MKQHSDFEKQFGGFLQLSTHLTYDAGIAHLGMYTSEMKSHIHAKTWVQMCAETLFTVAQTQKQPNVLQLTGG